MAAELGLPAPRVLGDPDRPNLLITLNSGTPGPHVGLCGHLDTKPVGAGEWATEPLVATVVGEEVRGRGVVDMKGAIAAMLLAAADISAAGLPAGRLSLVLCADEENGAVHGAELLTREHGALDLACLVIGEPGGIHTAWGRLHLGSGGMGSVFRALREATDRELAVKILPPRATHDSRYRTRFLREA
ncbi:MAG: M20/M25/M40 family metallo-hydrolase, partial [Actinomycetota bacterium]